MTVFHQEPNYLIKVYRLSTLEDWCEIKMHFYFIFY